MEWRVYGGVCERVVRSDGILAWTTSLKTDFIQTFMMSRATFTYISQRLSAGPLRRDARLRRRISPTEKVGVELDWLETEAAYCTLSNVSNTSLSIAAEWLPPAQERDFKAMYSNRTVLTVSDLGPRMKMAQIKKDQKRSESVFHDLSRFIYI